MSRRSGILRALAWLALLGLVVACAAPALPGAAGGPETADGIPSVSAPLALSPSASTLWVVNPDADTVTPVDTASLRAGTPIAVGGEPWSVAVTPAGTVVVMNRRDGSLTVVDDEGRRDLRVGAEPGGLALSPSGRFAYLTLSTVGAVAKVDLETLRVAERVQVGPMPWAIAVSDDGDELDDDERIVVTHRLARLVDGGSEGSDDGKEAWLSIIEGREVRELAIGGYEFGYPNALEGLALGSDEAVVVHLLNSPAFPRDFETTISAGLSSVPLKPLDTAGEAREGLRLHLNDESFSTPINFPRAISLSTDGTRAYLALAGSDAVMGIDLAEPVRPRLVGFWPAGANPRGIVIDPAGERAYVMNYLSRDVSVLDLTDERARAELARVEVAEEPLDPQTARGKFLFNNASDSRISHLGWISCASCHLDGGADGTTWLTPDGPRQTMPLWRLAGTAPFHASATRDEVQDFEHDVELLMAGSGLAPGTPPSELGAPSAGGSSDLDALAHYVLHGIRVPSAGEIDEWELQRGRQVFEDAGCAECHGGPAWTISTLPYSGDGAGGGSGGSVGSGTGARSSDSGTASSTSGQVEEALFDVGTFRPGVDVLGALGFDVPTLLGLHVSAPYLHDGTAAQLAEVLAEPAHVGSELSAGQIADLAAFLLTIDGETPPP